MEYKLISELDFAGNVKERLFGIFLVKDVEVKQQKNGSNYISFTMKCKDVEENAKRFEATDEEIAKIKNGVVCYAAIDVKPYAKSNTGYGCVIYNIDTYDALPASAFVEWADGMNEAHNTISNALTVICESDYKELVYPILTDYWDKFCIWTAASGMHHNILGGLLVHTAEVIDQCNILSDYWDNKYGANFINKPLLLSAALLHDLCKIDELEVDSNSGSTAYSTHSSLSTHIMDIISRVDVQAYKIGLGRQFNTLELNDNLELKTEEQIKSEREILLLLRHCLAAHHGKQEYGSPIVPNIPEAVILNMADNISAEMFKYNKDFRGMEPGSSTHAWTAGGINVTYKDSSK